MPSELDIGSFPELIFGLAGPIGVSMDEITTSLSHALKSVGYSAVDIKLTKAMKDISVTVEPPASDDYFDQIIHKMAYATALCHKYGSADAMARIAIRAITYSRSAVNKDATVPKSRMAYIVRQLKRPQEVELFRRIYGRQFILVSAYGSIEDRRKKLISQFKLNLVPPEKHSEKIDQLMDKDADEDDGAGQHLRDTFPLADVFIDGINRTRMDEKILRFVQALFGRTDIAPSKHEYGMYAAKSASLRSSDLSRQVGAAIFSSDGEIITQGCNEVPKAFGGTYWDLEEPDFRDVRLGHDPNEMLKRELLRDLFQRMLKADLLSPKLKELGSVPKIVDVLTAKTKREKIEGSPEGVLNDASIMDLTEYGRVVHAEMCAVCDAARLGKSVKGATLFCTTFPCHNCTKHIIAAGIKKVVYIEPYPKSKAKELHENEIEIEKEVPEKVSFVPVLGISPFRYRDIFQKGKRKNSNGTARRWYDKGDVEKPMVDDLSGIYTILEAEALVPLLYDMKPHGKTSIIPDNKSVNTGPALVEAGAERNASAPAPSSPEPGAANS